MTAALVFSGGTSPQILAREYFLARGISLDSQNLNELRAVSPDQTVQLLGKSNRKYPSLVIPYLHPITKEQRGVRVRFLGHELPTDEKGKLQRYDRGRGTPNLLYFPRAEGLDWSLVLVDPDQPLVITEGEAKAIKATQEGIVTLAVSGVWNWRGNKTTIPDLDMVNWRGRPVALCFDSDCASNSKVQGAAQALAIELTKRGALVKIARLPSEPDGTKNGMDDYLEKHGVEAMKQVLARAEPLEVPEDDVNLKQIVGLKDSHLDITHYLADPLASLIIQAAHEKQVPSEWMFTTLLPVCASLLGTSARVVLKTGADSWVEPCVIQAGVVADTGMGKTPAQSAIIRPLEALERQANEVYKLANEQYEDDLADYNATPVRERKGMEKPKAPTRRRHVTSDTTIESLIRIHSENPRGLLVYRDELAGNFKARDMYRGGKGSDAEIELQMWNGSAISKDRGSGSIYMEESAISRTGGIQPQVLGKLMGEGEDFNGEWARWLFTMQPPLPRVIDLSDSEVMPLGDVLSDLYRGLLNLSDKSYCLSLEAKQVYTLWANANAAEEQDTPAPGLRATYPKLRAYAARLALVLHLVNACIQGITPDTYIDADGMHRGIALANYFLSQWKLIYATVVPGGGLGGVLVSILKLAERKGAVTARDVQRGVFSLRKAPPETIRDCFQKLAEMGYGTLGGDEKNLKFLGVRDKRDRPTQKEAQSGFDSVTNPRDNDVTHRQTNAPTSTPAAEFVTFVTPLSPPSSTAKTRSRQQIEPFVDVVTCSTDLGNFSPPKFVNTVDTLTDWEDY